MPASLLEFIQHHRRIETDAALESAERYIPSMEWSLNELENQERKELDDLFENPSEGGYLDEEEYEKFVDQLNEKIGKNFTTALRYSFCTFLHTIFETQLFRVCKAIKEDRNLNLSVSELKGSAIDQAKAFLSKVANLNVGDWKHWATLQDFQKVRDCVIHSNGMLTDSRHAQRLSDMALPGLSIEEGKIVLSDKFALAYLQAIKMFFEEIFFLLGWKNELRLETRCQPKSPDQSV